MIDLVLALALWLSGATFGAFGVLAVLAYGHVRQLAATTPKADQ